MPPEPCYPPSCFDLAITRSFNSDRPIGGLDPLTPLHYARLDLMPRVDSREARRWWRGRLIGLRQSESSQPAADLHQPTRDVRVRQAQRRGRSSVPCDARPRGSVATSPRPA